MLFDYVFWYDVFWCLCVWCFFGLCLVWCGWLVEDFLLVGFFDVEFLFVFGD